MTELNGGRPIFVEAEGERIGRGPWARWFATSVVPDEGSPRAERGRILARTGHVHTVEVNEGTISASVTGSVGGEYRVSLSAEPVAPRIWAAVAGSVRGRALLDAATGREQSLQLEHVMTVDWEEPLVPPSRSVRRSCTCPDAERQGACKHVAALGYVVAAALDNGLELLLEWRGCATQSVSEASAARAPLLPRGPELWAAGPLPDVEAPRALPVGAVLKRLGTSGLVVDGIDLRDALEPAYVVFADTTTTVDR